MYHLDIVVIIHKRTHACSTVKKRYMNLEYLKPYACIKILEADFFMILMLFIYVWKIKTVKVTFSKISENASENLKENDE